MTVLSDMCLWSIVLCRHYTERCYINWLEAAARHITSFTTADYQLQRKNFFLLVAISFLCKKIVLRSWVLKQMQKIYWNEHRLAWKKTPDLHYMLRIIIFWQTLWIHSYSPNLESKVPRCNERSLSVNLGPSSWSPAFFWFLKIYLRRTCKKNEKKSDVKETLSVDVVRWWLRSGEQVVRIPTLETSRFDDVEEVWLGGFSCILTKSGPSRKLNFNFHQKR